MNSRILMFAALLAIPPQILGADPTPTVTNPPTETNAITATVTNVPDTNTPASSATNTLTKTPPDSAATNAFRAMQVSKGYRLQLSVAEPLIHSPVALAFDASGRLYVAELPPDPTQGRIKLLEDTNGDGVFDKVSVFADKVLRPTALICYGGGIFVASGSKIIFLADTTGKGSADVNHEIFDGFETGNASINYGGGINNFTWGVDNRIHAATAGMGGNISCLAIPTTETLQLNGFDFAFDPRTLAMTIEAGGVNRGVSFDNGGRRYTCTAESPVEFTVADPIRTSRNPYFVWLQLTEDISPASIAQARQASSLLVYRGGALSASAINDVFVADTGASAIYRLHLRDNGFVPVLGRPATESGSPFLTSRDASFRPLQVVSGPDGTLYVADLARVSLRDANEDGGRIWRISPTSLKPQATPKLATFKTAELVSLLASQNGWVRDTVARLLCERRDTNSIPLLARQLVRSKEPLARLHSLHVLSSLDALTEADVIGAMRDEDERVREHAVMLAEVFVHNWEVSHDLWARLATIPNDISLRVRFQAAFTLGLLQRHEVPVLLANILRNAPGDRATQFAVLTTAGARADAVFINLVGDRRVNGLASGMEFLQQLARITGEQNTTGMDQFLAAIERAQLDPLTSFRLARYAGEGLTTAGRSYATAAPQGTWRAYGQQALNLGITGNAVELRAEAIRFLGVSGYTSRETTDWLLAFLVSDEPQAVQSAAIESLARFDDPFAIAAFVQRWPSLSEMSQREIITKMLARFGSTMALMTALEQKRIPLTALTAVQVNFLRSHRDQNTAARAVALFGPKGRTGLAEQFAPAVPLQGSAARGQTLFNARCATCHSRDGKGRAFGPSLNNVASDRLKLLQDILEPDREMRPDYQTTVVQRLDSELVVGLVSHSGPDVLLVRQLDGTTLFIPRTEVENTFTQSWSLMPENTAAGMSANDLADLIEFLITPR